jgi:hypothetical protein
MKYIRLYWTHDRRDMPVWLISELNDENWETRKVEIWRGGAKGYADRATSYGSTGLAQVPLPPFDEITALPGFELEEISRAEFEREWNARTSP